MLIITSETHPATAGAKGLLARSCRHGNPGAGRAAPKTAVNEIHPTSDPESRSAVHCIHGALRMPLDDVLRSRVERLIQDGVRRVLLDLSGVSSIDAAGVGELVHLFITAAAAGGVLEIGRLRPRVRRVLEVTGVLGLLESNMPGVVRRGDRGDVQ